MKNFEDLIGKKFNRLTVIKLAYKKKIFKKDGSSNGYHKYWLCKCDCGNSTIVCGIKLKNGKTKSCGCYHSEIVRSIGINSKKHGKSNIRLYKIYMKMKGRCYNKTKDNYKYYGGRGIIICQEWLDDFMNFYNWAITNGYKEDLTIDRINVDGNYEPSNCRWVDMNTQCNNKTTTKYITYLNETHSISEWSNIIGINRTTISYRLKSGWDIKKTLTTSVSHKK